jgi:hypothetical protein
MRIEELYSPKSYSWLQNHMAEDLEDLMPVLDSRASIATRDGDSRSFGAV